MKLLNSNMHETHSVFIISVIETLALQKYNSMPAGEKRGLVAKYIAGCGIKGNLQQISPVWNPAAPLRRLPLKLLKGTCL